MINCKISVQNYEKNPNQRYKNIKYVNLGTDFLIKNN